MDESPYRSPQIEPAKNSRYSVLKQIALYLVVLLVAENIGSFVFPDKFGEWRMNPPGRIAGLSILALGLLSSIFFIIDAFRREYYSSRELPIALAIMGLFSFGILSVVYYVFWGWRELRVEYANGFCDACVKETTEYDQSLDLSTINLVNGGRLVGSAKNARFAVPP